MQNYVMVGAGGTGSHLVTPLVTYLRSRGEPFTLHVIDGDHVEEKNLERQLFTPGQVMQNKAEALIAPFGETEELRAYPEYLGEENIGRFIKSGDIVLICADNFTVRKRIEEHAQTLEAVTVINGGNEEWSGSVQLYVREAGKDVTPPISFLHPEIQVAVGDDRAEMTCFQAAQLPGGEQTIIANQTSAAWMLQALWRFHRAFHVIPDGHEPSPTTWTEVQFNAMAGFVELIDTRIALA